jgi:hypothetical protein
MAAMVARKTAHEAVFHHPASAVGALEPVATGPAQGQRRITTPVEEQQALFAAFDTLF